MWSLPATGGLDSHPPLALTCFVLFSPPLQFPLPPPSLPPLRSLYAVLTASSSLHLAHHCTLLLHTALSSPRLPPQTEHDFHLEKQRLVVAAKLSMAEEFANKEKKLDVEKRIRESGAAQENAFREMNKREEVMQLLKGDTLAAIMAAATGDKAKYTELLEQLVLEAMLKMEEADLIVRCRVEDIDLVKSVCPAALAKFKEQAVAALEDRAMNAKNLKRAMDKIAAATLTVNDNPAKHLAASTAKAGSGTITCAGGIILEGFRGRIVCDNTLDTYVYSIDGPWQERFVCVCVCWAGCGVRGVCWVRRRSCVGRSVQGSAHSLWQARYNAARQCSVEGGGVGVEQKLWKRKGWRVVRNTSVKFRIDGGQWVTNGGRRGRFKKVLPIQ